MVDRSCDYRVVHLDFKGAIPKISFLEEVFSLISSWGATGVLIEYEDSFPYQGEYSVLQAPSSFSISQITDIQTVCRRNNLEIIPLIQTFGHLEFILKHDVFRHLREMDLYPNALCPFHPESPDLIFALVRQIVELHSESKFLHIGADEVWHLGRCERCLGEMELRNWSPTDIYLHWITKIAKIVHQNYPNIKLIVWDDMMRTVPVSKLKEFGISNFVELMIWKYDAKDFQFPAGMFERFSEVFDYIWMASSFKGASGSTQFLPPIQHHIDNHLSWLAIIDQQRASFKVIRGIVLTGWQRYDHYAVLCELLPVSIPSLALCLKVLQRRSFLQEDHESVSTELGFTGRINVFPFPRPQVVEPEILSFPGWKLFIAIQMWSNFVFRYQMICNSEAMLGWFSDYFRSKNFTNPAQVENILSQIQELEVNMVSLKAHMETCFLEIYYLDTWQEWNGCFLDPMLSRIKVVIGDCKKQITIGGRIRGWKPPENCEVNCSVTDSCKVTVGCDQENIVCKEDDS